jgi:hypothetical protein
MYQQAGLVPDFFRCSNLLEHTNGHSRCGTLVFVRYICHIREDYESNRRPNTVQYVLVIEISVSTTSNQDG